MMQTATFSSALLLLLFSSSYLQLLVEAGKGSGESGECQKRRDTCGHLCEEPPPSTTVQPSSVPTPAPGQCVCTPAPGSGENGDFHSRCILIEAFYNMSLSLTISEQVEWEAWIQECENSILANSSLSNDQKVVLVSLSLKAFLSVHIEIYNKLSFKQIGGWGALIDFMYVEVQIELEITQSVVTVDGNGDCDLTGALENGTSESSASDKAAVQQLIVDIKLVLEDSSYTYEQQLAVCWDLFQAFFVQHPQLEELVVNIEIEGYGPLKAFLNVCKTFKRIVNLKVAIGGNSTSDCPLLEGLQAATQNASFNLSVQVQINQLLLKLEAYFQNTTDISLRLEYVSASCYQLFLMEPWMVSIIKQISCGDWGDIYDIIFCSNICTNYGCGNPNQGPGPQVDSTTAAPSTAAPSTAAPSTAAASTATPTTAPADCNTVGSLITVDVSSNTTILTNVLTSAYNTWTFSQKLGFNSVFNMIRKAIWDDVTYPTQTAKLHKCRDSLLSYNANNVTAQQLVFNITINIWVGTVGQFVACIN